MDFKAPTPARDYKVLVKCMTYNQEKYIEDALKGFVRQKTDFSFCVLVVDDCSVDDTAKIIKRYEQKFPDIIKGIYLPVNMYGNPEKNIYTKPWEDNAQYVAMCEGDDYWIDDYKLQRQVDFLDTHPDYMMHFHNALVRYQNHNRPDHLIRNFESGDFDTTQIFENWQLPLASVLFRREVLLSKEFTELNKVRHNSGFCLFIAASLLGKVYGLSECLSVYRKNDNGISNLMSQSYCLQLNYGFAKASNDEGAMKIMNKRALKLMSALFMSWILRNKDAIEMKNSIDKYDKTVFYKAMLFQPYIVSKKVLRKILVFFR